MLPAHEVTWDDFGVFLQRLRRRRGLSQERMADLLGCHHISIWRLEHRQRHPSKLFLHNLEHTCTLTEQEKRLLAAFVLLHMAYAPAQDKDA